MAAALPTDFIHPAMHVVRYRALVVVRPQRSYFQRLLLEMTTAVECERRVHSVGMAPQMMPGYLDDRVVTTD